LTHVLVGASLLLMLVSLGFSLLEIRMSSDALNILLADLEDHAGQPIPLLRPA
jgi:hypothetical protein